VQVLFALVPVQDGVAESAHSDAVRDYRHMLAACICIACCHFVHSRRAWGNGYDLEPGETGARRINTAEAEVVGRIFRDCAAGRSPKSIALALNAEALPGIKAAPGDLLP